MSCLLRITWTLLIQALSSNPSFVNRDVRAQELIVESEGEKDVDNGPLKDEIEEVPRAVSDAEYVVFSALDVCGLMYCIV